MPWKRRCATQRNRSTPTCRGDRSLEARKGATIASMLHVDAAILNATERFARRFQVLTGRTNIWLAVQLTNLSIVVYFVWAAAYFWNRDLTIRVFVGGFCAAVLYA